MTQKGETFEAKSEAKNAEQLSSRKNISVSRTNVHEKLNWYFIINLFVCNTMSDVKNPNYSTKTIHGSR
jgi:hypothetical protein